MKLRLEQLAGALAKEIAPVYLFSGDEPLQLGEAADAARAAARAAGYANREVFAVEGAGFDWSLLLEARDSFSLFGDKRILDLRLSAKPDKAGAEALENYAKRLPDDAVLIAALPRLSAADQKARWLQALESKGVFVQIWPPEGPALIQWLAKRMGAKKMLADDSALRILAARVEGNLLAAAQEIEKLHILHGPVHIGDDMMRKAVADSARYDVYGLAEAAMEGHMARARRILAGLRAEGVAPPVILWALARDIRLLCGVKALTERGEPLESAFAKQREKVWDKRKTGLTSAARRLGLRQAQDALLLCAHADRIIKGQTPGDEWEALFEVCLGLRGGN